MASTNTWLRKVMREFTVFYNAVGLCFQSGKAFTQRKTLCRAGSLNRMQARPAQGESGAAKELILILFFSNRVKSDH